MQSWRMDERSVDHVRDGNPESDRICVGDILRLAAIACLFWVFACGLAAYTVSAHPDAPVGAAGRGEAIRLYPWSAERARILCGFLDPQAVIGHFVEDTAKSQMRNGTIRETVSIDCLTAKGEHVATLVWEAQTRVLISIGHTVRKPVSRTDRPLDRDAAVRFAQRWLEVLGIDDGGTRWKVARVPKLESGQWRVWLSTGERIASVQLSRASGMLYSLRVSPDRSSGPSHRNAFSWGSVVDSGAVPNRRMRPTDSQPRQHRRM